MLAQGPQGRVDAPQEPDPPPLGRWHQFYAWEAINCPELFPERELRGLIADRITPPDMGLDSRALVKEVGRKMVRMVGRLEPVARVACGEPAGVPGVDEYFLPRRSGKALGRLLGRGNPPDFDSVLGRVGVEALWFRVLDLSRDFDEGVLQRMGAFRSAWRRHALFLFTWVCVYYCNRARRYEVQNIARHRGDKTVSRAGIEYKLCRLLRPPTQEELDAMGPVELAQTLRGPVCGRWTSVLALSGLGAFDFSQDDQ